MNYNNKRGLKDNSDKVYSFRKHLFKDGDDDETDSSSTITNESIVRPIKRVKRFIIPETPPRVTACDEHVHKRVVVLETPERSHVIENGQQQQQQQVRAGRVRSGALWDSIGVHIFAELHDRGLLPEEEHGQQQPEDDNQSGDVSDEQSIVDDYEPLKYDVDADDKSVVTHVSSSVVMESSFKQIEINKQEVIVMDDDDASVINTKTGLVIPTTSSPMVEKEVKLITKDDLGYKNPTVNKYLLFGTCSDCYRRFEYTQDPRCYIADKQCKNCDYRLLANRCRHEGCFCDGSGYLGKSALYQGGKLNLHYTVRDGKSMLLYGTNALSLNAEYGKFMSVYHPF